MRQIRDQPVLGRQPATLAVVVQELDLHLRDVDSGRTFAFAAFAGDAQIERLVYRVGSERVGAELARDREPQRIRAPARQVLLVARRTV